METQPLKSTQAMAGWLQREACEVPSLFKCLLPLPPFFCSLRKNKTRGRGRSKLFVLLRLLPREATGGRGAAVAGSRG